LLLIATLLSIFELLRGSVGHRTLLVHCGNNFSRGLCCSRLEPDRF
jgi:hypothetical protein